MRLMLLRMVKERKPGIPGSKTAGSLHEYHTAVIEDRFPVRALQRKGEPNTIFSQGLTETESALLWRLYI